MKTVTMTPTGPGQFQAPRVIPWGGSAANIGATMRGAPLTLRIRLGRTLLVPLIWQPSVLAPLISATLEPYY